MKIKHHKTLWVHTLYSIVLTVGLALLVLIRRDVPTAVLAVLLVVYIIGNSYIHIKRDDLKRETIYEYILLGFAVFIVVSSAALN